MTTSFLAVGLRSKRVRAVLACLTVLTLLALGLQLTTRPALAADGNDGCGYGSTGPSADTICWIDMSNFDATEAQTDGGQDMSIKLPGGYTMTFDAKLRPSENSVDGKPRPMVAHAFPTYGGAVLGNAFYKDTPGKPALWITPADQGENWTGWVGKVTLDNVVVKNAAGEVNKSYSLIAADAESTDSSGGSKPTDVAEGLRFTSDTDLTQLAGTAGQPANYPAACAGGLTGLGSTSVQCVGLPGGGTYSAQALILNAKAPGMIAGEFRTAANSREAMAFGVQFSTVQATKKVVDRYDSNDQFTVSTSVGDETLSKATTSGSGASDSASTGRTTLVSAADGDDVTFSESASAGDVDWKHYTTKWLCTRNGETVSDSELTESDGGRSVTATVKPGQFVDCTVTNTGKLGSVAWSKVDSDGSGVLSGSEWKLTGPDGTSATVVDNGQNDTDDAAGKLAVKNLKWGDYTLVETKAPQEHLLDPTPKTFTVSEGDLSIDLGDVKNTAAKPGLVVKKSADPASGSRVNPGQVITYTVAVENTGNVDLSPATVNDDLSDVVDNAAYVDGSAKATIGDAAADAPVVSGTTLKWSGALKAGAKATLTYQVKVNDDVTAKDKLVNVVTGSGDVPPGVTPPTPNCVPDTAKENADCTTNHTPNDPTPPSPTPTEPTTPPTEPVTPNNPNGHLPRTGGEVMGAVAGGLLLVAVGGLAFYASRRRSQH